MQDISPIENLWAIWKREMNKEYIFTEEVFYESADRIWKQTSKDLCESLISSMPTRIEKLIRANGDVLKYQND